MSNYTDHFGDQKGAYHDDTIRCYAYIAPEKNFATRANTLQEYCRINRQVTYRQHQKQVHINTIQVTINHIVFVIHDIYLLNVLQTVGTDEQNQ